MAKKDSTEKTVQFPVKNSEEHKKFQITKRDIIVGIITGTVVLIIGALLSNVFALPIRVERLEGDANNLNNEIQALESQMDSKMSQLKDDLQGDISDVRADIGRLENLLLPFLQLKPSQEVAQQISYTYGGVDRIEPNGGLSLTLTSIVAFNDNGAEFTADQLTDIRLLLPYRDGNQEVFFYGQFDDQDRWDGECLVNIYENGKLKLITDAVYENGKLLNFKQAFPDQTTGGQAVWTFSERTVEDDFSTGQTWHYFRNGDYEQNFKFNEVTAKDMIAADEFRTVIDGNLEGYYSGIVSDGYFNDDTGTAYMIKYFIDGTVKTLYAGNFVDGQFEDQSGNAWMIGKIHMGDPYSYYQGNFRRGEPDDDKKHWSYDIPEERIDEILEAKGFQPNCNLMWELPTV